MSKTILLADDSVTIQKVVGLTIANQDYKLVAVSDGDEAIGKASEIKPDILIADAVMPKMDGYEVCRALKSNPATANIPVIILAGTFEPYDEAKGNEVGVDAVIVKPFDSQAFLNTVAQTLKTGAKAHPGVVEAVAVEEPMIELAIADEPIVAEAVVETPEFADIGFGEVEEPLMATAADELDFGDLNAEASEPVIAQPVVEEAPELQIPGLEPVHETAIEEEMTLDSFNRLSIDEQPSEPLAVETVSMPDATEDAVTLEPETVGGVSTLESDHAARESMSIPDAYPLESDALTVGPKAVQAVTDAAQGNLAGVDKETIEKVAREEIQKIIWEIVPELAEAVIREEINKLLARQTGA